MKYSVYFVSYFILLNCLFGCVPCQDKIKTNLGTGNELEGFNNKEISKSSPTETPTTEEPTKIATEVTSTVTSKTTSKLAREATSTVTSKTTSKLAREATSTVTSKTTSKVATEVTSTVTSKTTSKEAKVNEISSEKPPKFVCPGTEISKPLFPLPCTVTKECAVFGRGLLCCDGVCLKGVQPPKPEPVHSRNELEGSNNKKLSKPSATEKATTENTKKITTEVTSTVISKTTSKLANVKEISSEKPVKLVCPGSGIARPFFSLRCTATKECTAFGRELVCCDGRCLKGVQPPKPEPLHSPTFFGFVQRKCPAEPIPEIWDIKECATDADCTPRICCPETLRTGENVSFCRMAEPLWEKMPAASQFAEPIRNLVSYMQCTPPPPPLLDLFPKACKMPLDCFPNLCCQEGRKRFCRPPKRSLLALVAGIGQRIIPSDYAREFIKRIS